MEDIKYICGRLICLLEDRKFKLELHAYRQAFKRLSIRLRNNSFTAKLKQLATLSRKLQYEFPDSLFRSYHDKLEVKPSRKQKHAMACLKKHTGDLVKFLDSTLDKTLEVYCMTQSRFKVGHLIPHYIMIRASISRLLICFKALLVYSCDLSSAIADHQGVAIDKAHQLDPREVLIKHHCKPQVKVNSKRNSDLEAAIQIGGEKIGKLISRETFNKAKKSSKRVQVRQIQTRSKSRKSQ